MDSLMKSSYYQISFPESLLSHIHVLALESNTVFFQGYKGLLSFQRVRIEHLEHSEENSDV
jgi:hypothetical protein